MALIQYISDTRLLLNDTASEYYTDGELTSYINRARGYVAGLGECVEDSGVASVTTAIFYAAFSTFVPTRIQAASKLLKIRSVQLASGGPIELRNFDWWLAYVLTNPLLGTRRIAAVAYQGWGAAGEAKLAIKAGTSALLPYSVVVDGFWVPVALTSDLTVEDLPNPWTDSVCYYAAYLAYTRAQRQADAATMLQVFNEKLDWARRSVTPSRLTLIEAPVGGTGTQQAGTYGSLASGPQRGSR